MLVPVWRDRTQKPPLGTPLRSDGHWSVQGLVGAWAFNEGAGATSIDSAGHACVNTGVKITVKGFEKLAGIPGHVTTVATFPTYTPSTQIGKLTIMTATNNGGIFDANSGDKGFSISVSTASACNLRFRKDDLTTDTTHITPNNIFAVGTPFTLAVVYRQSLVGADVLFYKDGSLQPAGTTTNGGSLLSGTGTLRVGSTQSLPAQIYEYWYSYSCVLTPIQIASISANPWQIYEPELTFIETDPKILQSYYRFRNDDGSETSATWLANENTNITQPADANIRLRLLLESQGNPASKDFQLEYRKVGDTVWNKVTTL